MEEHEQKPQWYDLARKGPFQDKKFTEAAADSVVRQLQPGGSARGQALQAGRRRRGIRVRILSVAVILLLIGAGALVLGIEGSGHSGGYNPLKAVHAGIIEPPVGGQADLTDAGLRRTAERVVQEQFGKEISFNSLERQKEGEESVAKVLFQEGNNSATIWINTETGKVFRTVMNVVFSPEEINSAFIDEALGHLRRAGYKGGFTITGLRHSSHYGTNDDEQGVQTDDGLMGDEGQIDYENGVYRSSTFRMSEDEVSAEVTQAGLRAIKLLREQGTDHLYSIMRTVAPKWDILVLTYGESERGATTVLMDYVTQDIIQVEDIALYDENSFNYADPNTNLLDMDKAKLQHSAAAIADKMFGIRLEDYTFVKEMSGIGRIAFKSPDGATVITGLYNLDGVFYMIQQTDAAE